MENRVTAEDGVKLIQAESERLKIYLDGLSPEALNRPSACQGWTVADVVAHLVWVAKDYYGVAIMHGLRGDTSFPEGLSRSGPAESAATDAFMAQQAVACRKRLGGQLLPTVKAAIGQFTTRLTGLAPQDWEKPVYHPNGVRTVASYVPGMIQELVLHEWDFRSGLESSPALSVNGLPYLMRLIPRRRLPSTSPFPVSSASSDRIGYQFNLTGPDISHWEIVVEANAARLEPAGDVLANVSLTYHTDTFVLLMYRRLTLKSAIDARRMTVEGDPELILDFDQWLKGT